MKELSCQLLVIGGGPGGYVCAIRAGQLGIDTIIVEASQPGGTCLNVGCIPSKAVIHAADEFEKLGHYSTGQSPLGIRTSDRSIDLSATMTWKDGIVQRLNQGVLSLLKKSGVSYITGVAHFLDGKTIQVDNDDGPFRIHADNAVIATGSQPLALPGLPFGGNVISSTEALALTELPRHFVVIGAGYIGLELGMAFAKLGSQVTVVEAQDKILPQYDAELTRPVLARLKSLGVEILLQTRVKGLSIDGTGLEVESDQDGSPRPIAADKILVAVGRQPVIDGWGRDELVLELDGRFLQTNLQCKTNMRGIFAIGDVTGEPMLAHRAMAQGEMVAELVAGKKRQWDKVCIPAVCFTDPEIVSVGISVAEAEDLGIATVIGKVSFRASGRAMTTERDDGFIRIVARADNHLVIGVQGVGATISELSTAMGLAIEMGCRLEDIAATIHAHPTRGETLAEAAMDALGHALHA